MDFRQYVGAHTRVLLGGGVAAVLALTVVAVVVVPRISADDPADSADHPAPASCRPDAALDHHDFRSGTAVWVLSCPRVGRLPSLDALLPAGTVTTGAAALVKVWQQHSVPSEASALCGGPGGSPDATVQIGFADGTVSQVDIGCVGEATPGPDQITLAATDLMDQLATALAQQNDARYPAAGVPPARQRCPVALHRPAQLNVDGASAATLDDTGALLDLTPVASLVCRYDDKQRTQTRRDLAPRPLLLATGTGWFLPSAAVRGQLQHVKAVRQGLSDYLVVLRDKTGTSRTFTITGHYGVLTLYRGDGTTDVPGYAGAGLLVALGLMKG